MKKVKLKLELQYNSPVILTFFLLSLLVLFLDQWTDGWTTMHLFCVYRSSLKDPLFYIRLFGHVLGHASWDHFLHNMLLLLVVGRLFRRHPGHHAAGCSAVLWSAGVRYHFCARQCSKLHAHCGRLMRHCLWLLQCAAQPPQAGKSGEVFQHEQPPEALNPLWT